MNKSRKTLLIVLMPALLTLYFIARVLFPAIGEYSKVMEQFKETKKTYQETQASIEDLQNNKKVLSELSELNKQVSDFDIQVPSEFQDEFLLVDLEKFSKSTLTRIISLDSKKEKEISIKNSADDKDKKSKKKSKNKKQSKKKKEKALPLIIYEKPFEIKTVGYYNNEIKFINLLENYQRKFVINGVSAQISKNDENNPNPRIELTIEGSTFKAVKTPEILESEAAAEEKTKTE